MDCLPHLSASRSDAPSCHAALAESRGRSAVRLALLVLAVAALLLPPRASYGKDVGASLLVGLYTRHVDPSGDTNEATEFIGLGYRDYTVASFVNSYHDQSYFAGKRYPTRRFHLWGGDDWFVQGNVYAGMVYGYHERVPNLEGFTPALVPTVALTYRNVAAEVLYVPTPSGGVFMSVLSIRLYGSRRDRVAELELKREFQEAALGAQISSAEP